MNSRNFRSRLGLFCFLILPGLVLASDDPKKDEPAKLEGTWSWTWKDAEGETHKHVLEVASTDGKLTASEKFDSEEPLKVTDLKIDGKKVSFSTERGKRRSSYTGKLESEDSMTGLVTVTTEGQASEYGWAAKREPAPKK